MNKRIGRPGGIRTPSIRFWRPALYQLELLACTSLKDHPEIVHQRRLLRLPMNLVTPASWTKFLHFQAFRGLLFVFGCRVISLFAVGTLHCNDVAHKTSLNPSGPQAMISATVPAPTVRPPSRMAKRSPFSSATGVISSIARLTLSPGITISTPSGNSADPVTSVVRK